MKVEKMFEILESHNISNIKPRLSIEFEPAHIGFRISHHIEETEYSERDVHYYQRMYACGKKDSEHMEFLFRHFLDDAERGFRIANVGED